MNAAEFIELPAGPNRLLMVDDDETILGAMKQILSREGYEVIVSTRPTAALEILSQTPMGVILSDQRMPELTGLEFLAKAKTIQPTASRVLTTAYLDPDTIIAAINTGEIFRFLVKPWKREELIATVRNASQRYELICRNHALQANTLAVNEKLAGLNEELRKQVAREAEQNQQLASLNTALHQNLRKSVELCLKMMQTFYPSLGNRARRVAELCKHMADDLQLPADERQVLEISALLHDVGLVGVPRDLIKTWQHSPGSLTQAERDLVQRHPLWGQELVGFMDHLEPVGKVIRAHHERFDGTGFPDGLSEDRIPWLGRLLAVAVGYAENNSPPQAALQAMEFGSGSAYDPEAVRLFLRCRPGAVPSRLEQELLLAELRPEMVLAKGVYAANGLLLMPEGQRLNASHIDKLWNHHRVNPIRHKLLVYR